MTQPHYPSYRREAALEALERIANASEAIQANLEVAITELVAVRKMAEKILDQRPFPPDQSVRLSTDSNGRTKPEVDVHGRSLAECEAQAVATMTRLLEKFPPPPPKPAGRPRADEQ